MKVLLGINFETLMPRRERRSSGHDASSYSWFSQDRVLHDHSRSRFFQSSYLQHLRLVVKFLHSMGVGRAETKFFWLNANRAAEDDIGYWKDANATKPRPEPHGYGKSSL